MYLAPSYYELEKITAEAFCYLLKDNGYTLMNMSAEAMDWWDNYNDKLLERKEALIASAKAKLTSEELAALNLLP
jgi:hypothetical protein